MLNVCVNDIFNIQYRFPLNFFMKGQYSPLVPNLKQSFLTCIHTNVTLLP